MTTTAAANKDISVCIPIPQRPWGGMYTFLGYFRDWLGSRGIPCTEDMDADYSVLFVNSFMVPYGLVRRVKKRLPGVVVVQRVDGSTRDYGRYDDSDFIQSRVNLLADLTIYQSEYSKFSTTSKYRVIGRDGPIIYNPVDTELFRPRDEAGQSGPGPRVCSASFSLGVKKGTWKIAGLAKENPDVTFVLCGRFPEMPKLPNIELLGHLDRRQMADALRGCDVFMHLAENDPCPNVVIEALASGLPVLYKDSGGSPELVGDCGLPVGRGNFRERLEDAMGRKDELSRAARERAVTMFSADVIFPKYMESIASARRRPLPGAWDIVSASLRGYPVAEAIAYAAWGKAKWKLAGLRHRFAGPAGGRKT